MVERGELPFAQPLDDRQDRCVNESEIEIRVLLNQRGHPHIVLEGQVFHEQGARLNIPQYRDDGQRGALSGCQGVNFGEHGRGDYDHLLGLPKELPAPAVVPVSSVQRGVQDARIDDQRHDTGGTRSVASVEAISVRLERKTPMLFGLGR